MRRNNDQAQSMKRRFTDERNRARCNWMPVSLWGLASNGLLALALIGALWGSPKVSGQSGQPTPALQTLPPNAAVVVSVSKPETQSRQFQFAGNEPPKVT